MKQKWFLDYLQKYVHDNFHRLSGFLSASLLVVIFSFTFYQLIPEKSFYWKTNLFTINFYLSFANYLVFVAIIIIVIFIYWLSYKYYYPKRTKNKLGFIVAVYIEDDQDIKLFREDFISPLKTKINDLKLPFDILFLKNHQSKNVKTECQVQKLLKKTKSHFCIWGSIKKRSSNNKDQQRYITEIRGAVVHSPIEEMQKVLLSKEFNNLLPYTYIFQEEIQFEGFKFRSDQVFIALDYITGRAALLSGDFKTAIILHETLLQNQSIERTLAVKDINLKRLLSLEYDIKINYEIINNKDVLLCKLDVEKALKYDPNNYGALLKRSAIEFKENKEKLALRTVLYAKQFSKGDYSWLYNKIFLLFWLEKYETLFYCLKQIKKKTFIGEEYVIQEVIHFIEKLFHFSDKPQLYYWLGFILYEKNKNLSLSDYYFQKFIENISNTTLILEQSANEYLSNIKKEIGY